MQKSEMGLLRTKTAILAVFFFFFLSCGFVSAQTASASLSGENPPAYLSPLPQDTGAPGLKQALRRAQNTGRLMMVTAHPDDEDGGVLTLQARGHGIHTLLMTLTRGEGGQNELGTGLFDKLGVIRTLELLASDRYYGVEQRFSRVADFGFSKTPEETFQNWGGKDVPLADMVRVIRTFRPDVLVARFSGTERDGHAHHQASAILTKEAFRAAADPNRFPEQIKEGLQPWQPKKLYIGNVCGFRSNTCADENWTVRFDTGNIDPVLGMSYLQMAMNGLAHQHTQGHGEFTVPPGPHYSFYKLVDSVLPKTVDQKGHEKDFFDGIDTSLPGLTAKLKGDDSRWLVGELRRVSDDVDEAEKKQADGAAEPLLDAFNRLNSAAIRVHNGIRAAKKTPLIEALNTKEGQANSALNLAFNISAEAVATGTGAVSPGDNVKLRVRFHNGSRYDLRTSYGGPLPGLDLGIAAPHLTVRAGEEYSTEVSAPVLNTNTVSFYTRPYWHRQNPETNGVSIVDQKQFQTLPFAPSPFHEDVAYAMSHHPTPQNEPSWRRPWPWMSVPVITDMQVADGSSEKRELAIVPAFSVALEPGEQVIPLSDGKTTIVKVSVSQNSAVATKGNLRLQLPEGWREEPANFDVALPKRGDKQDFSFKVFPGKLSEGRSEVHAVLEAGGKKYSEGYELVGRDDIGFYYYYQPAEQHVSIVDVEVPKDLKVAYIQGAGEDTPTVLQQVGMNITVLPAEKLATTDISQYGSIVLGVRAYDAQKDVVANNAKLLKFVSDGGTLVVEHNNDISDFNSGHYTPYPAELGRARVSVEEAPVQILAPDDPIFHFPNEITQKDFQGWVQERGLYFMSSWDDHFKPLISCHDPNEPDQKGGLLMAKYGKGTYIYSGYSFYRQLPAGVAGAVRLFVNLVSAGHSPAASN
jgi:LmbE family N-acetylglucosaminyl deacetylase